MAAVQKITLYSNALSGDTSSEAISLEGLQTDFVGILSLTALSATNVIVKIQRSADKVIWGDWITFATLTATGSEIKDATAPGLSYVRVSFDFTGGAQTGTAAVYLCYDKKSK
jgi:hypothetical protein